MTISPDSGASRRPIRRALVSVYDKSGLEDLVRGLHDAGVVLVSTGGSAKLIEGLGLPVTKVEDLTGFLKERRISAQKLPERPVLLDRLPMTATGKVQKFVLREMVREG